MNIRYPIYEGVYRILTNMTMEIKRDSWDIYKFPKTGKGTPISHRHAF